MGDDKYLYLQNFESLKEKGNIELDIWHHLPRGINLQIIL